MLIEIYQNKPYNKAVELRFNFPDDTHHVAIFDERDDKESISHKLHDLAIRILNFKPGDVDAN